MPEVMLILPKFVLIKVADKAKAKSATKGFNSQRNQQIIVYILNFKAFLFNTYYISTSFHKELEAAYNKKQCKQIWKQKTRTIEKKYIKLSNIKLPFIGFKYFLELLGIFHEKILIREEKNIVSLGSSRKTNLFPAENPKVKIHHR